MSAEQAKAIDLRYVRESDWHEFLNAGGTLGDAIDVKGQTIENIYGLAYEKYQAGVFQEALSLFKFLVYLNHHDARFYLGLGAVQQALKDYKVAGETFSYAALLKPNDPRFPFHAAQCHLALGNWRAAGSGFELAVMLCEEQSVYPQLHEQALAQFNVLKNKLQESESEDAP